MLEDNDANYISSNTPVPYLSNSLPSLDDCSDSVPPHFSNGQEQGLSLEEAFLDTISAPYASDRLLEPTVPSLQVENLYQLEFTQDFFGDLVDLNLVNCLSQHADAREPSLPTPPPTLGTSELSSIASSTPSPTNSNALTCEWGSCEKKFTRKCDYK
jgi:hypothetical protein